MKGSFSRFKFSLISRKFYWITVLNISYAHFSFSWYWVEDRLACFISTEKNAYFFSLFISILPFAISFQVSPPLLYLSLSLPKLTFPLLLQLLVLFTFKALSSIRCQVQLNSWTCVQCFGTHPGLFFLGVMLFLCFVWILCCLLLSFTDCLKAPASLCSTFSRLALLVGAMGEFKFYLSTF